MEKATTRRNFVKTGSTAMGVLAAAGLSGCRTPPDQKASSVAPVYFTEELTPDGLVRIYEQLKERIA